MSELKCTLNQYKSVRMVKNYRGIKVKPNPLCYEGELGGLGEIKVKSVFERENSP